MGKKCISYSRQSSHKEKNLFQRKKQPLSLLNFQFTDYFKGSYFPHS